MNPKRRAANTVRKDNNMSPRCVIGIGFGRTGQRGKQIAPPNRRVITVKRKVRDSLLVASLNQLDPKRKAANIIEQNQELSAHCFICTSLLRNHTVLKSCLPVA